MGYSANDINQKSSVTNQESKSKEDKIDRDKGTSNEKHESVTKSKQETKSNAQTKSSRMTSRYEFFYTHTFTAEEVRKQNIGNILGGITSFLPNLVREFSGVLTMQSLGQTAKGLGGSSNNYDAMLGALGTGLQAEEGLTYSQTTTVTCLKNPEGEIYQVIVETKSFIKKDSAATRIDEQKAITLTFTVVDGSPRCLDGKDEIKYPSVSALLADVAGAYNNPQYLNQSKARGDYQK